MTEPEPIPGTPPADDRDLIVLREWSGESFAAIGARFGVPENTARMRFSRAVGRLATQVDLLRRGVSDPSVRGRVTDGRVG